jgi:DHA1 family multidrug resistance protein-like MFS transporter
MKFLVKKMTNVSMGSWIVIVGILFTSIAKNIVIPFFAVYLVKNMNFSVASAGIAIAARIWGQRGLILISGPIIDWIGAKPIIIAGLLLMAISYFFTAFSSTLLSIVLWTLILGLGGAFYTTAAKTTIINEKSYEEKVFILSLRATALNVGSALGPLIGGLVFIMVPKMIFIFTAIMLMILTLISYFTIKVPLSNCENKGISLTDIKSILGNKKILKLILFMILFYMLLIQIEITYPLFAAKSFNNATVSYLFLLNALMIIVFQMPFSGWIARSSVEKIFLSGVLSLSVGFMLTSFSGHSQLVFLFSVAIFSFGEIIITPKLDSDITSYVSKNAAGTAFGLLGIASAVGAALGGILGGNIYHFFVRNHDANYYWKIMSILAILIALIVFVALKTAYFSDKAKKAVNSA